MTEEYIDSLVVLEEVCFTQPWTKGMFLGDLNSEHTCYYVALNNNGDVIGYAGMWLAVDEGQITNIAVHPDYRRKNIASDLLSYLFKVCADKNLCAITLEVREGNNNAISLYNKFGFESVGIRKNYYKNPTENALLMTKTFDFEGKD